MTHRRENGQVLPLFALGLVALMAMAALAIDVTGAYAARRDYRSVADAAALAGAQDLQNAGSRLVTAADRSNAFTHARQAVESHFGATSNCVDTSASRKDCTLVGQPYTFSVITPIPPGACLSCDPERSVQVTVANPTFPLTFARVLGQTEWNVASTSVAGLQHSKSYTIVTLRPPSSETIPGVRNIRIDGGTTVQVDTGDVVSNANMVYGGSGSILSLDPGYSMYYFDPANPPLWSSPPDPPGTKITSLVLDPGYVIPSRGTTPPAGSIDATNCSTIATSLLTSVYAPYLPVAAGAPDMANITCYRPGVYTGNMTIANGTVGILEPGLYFFDGVLSVQGSLIGGYEPASEGVALVFRESQGTQFKGRTSGPAPILPTIISLNAGSRLGNPAGAQASAAQDYAGGLVQTNITPPTLMTVLVERDARCTVTLPFPEPPCLNSVENQNIAIDLSGNSDLYLAGVQFGPSDNMTFSGGTSGIGYVGQVWAWTLKYTGGTTINQEGDANLVAGTLRLDAACTAPGTPCIP